METYTFFFVCAHRSHPTTYIISVTVESFEAAHLDAINECAGAWNLPVDTIHTLGIAKGDVSIIEWHDLES